MIEIKDLHFAYEKHEVLCNINLKINQGDFVAVLGNNGSGKSTLLKLILGFLKPNIGEIKMMDKNSHEFELHNVLGYVPQGGLLNVSSFPANVLEIVMLRLKKKNLFSFKKDNRKDLALKSLKKVGIENLAYQAISTLSGGQLQRVLIARELVVNPELIILDEPTTGLDSTSSEALIKILEQLNDQGITIVMVSHDFDEIKDHVNRVFRVKDRHITEVAL